MRRILLTIISLLPMLAYGQSMKIAPKQIEPGDKDGKVIITRNGVSVLDSVKWLDVNGKPTDLEHTSNKATNLNSPDNTTYPTTQAVTGWVTNNFVSTIPNSDNTQSANYSGDLNDLLGINQFNFNSNNAINKPPFFPYGGVLYNHTVNSNMGTQMALGWAGSSGGDYFGYRTKNGGLWSDWYRVASQSWVNSQGFLTSETDPIYTADKPNVLMYKGTLGSSDDLNDKTETGIYFCLINNYATTALHYPENGSGGVLEVIKYPGDARLSQRFTVGASQGQKNVYIRNKYGTSWFGWTKLANGDDIPAAQTLSINGHSLSLSGGGGTVTIPDNNTTYSAGTGLSLSGTTFNNTAPDQTVSLTNGTGISVSGTYPNFTITNTAPNQNYTLPTASASTLGGIKVGDNLSISSGVLSADVGTNDLFSGNYNDLTNKPNIPAQVNLTGAGATTVTGTYPNLTISSTDNNTTYSGSTSITLNGTSFRRAALTGDVTAAANSNVTTIANNAVTNAKISSVSWSKVTGAPAFITNETDPVYTADNENIMIRRDNLSSSENLNDVLVSGVYFQLVNNNATTALNYPLAGQGGVLEVFKGSDNRAMQRFTARPTSSTPITFVRRMYANAWSDWVQLANIDDIPTVNNGTLTLNTSGIATGSTTFSANQANNSSVTVNVPGTNLGGNFNATTGSLNVTSSTGNNATIGMPALQSGEYAPSVYNLSGFTNVTPASGGGYDFIYSQVGDVVTVSGAFEYTTDGSGGTSRTFDFDPPIPVTTMRAWGTGSYGVKTNGADAAVIGASNMLRITLNDDNNTTNQVYFTCQYIVD